MHLAPLFASTPRFNSAQAAESNTYDISLDELQQMLLPDLYSVSSSQSASAAGTNSTTQQEQVSGRTAEFELDKLRALVFRGIPETTDPTFRGTLKVERGERGTESAAGNLRPLAWRTLLGVVRGSPRDWIDQLRMRRSEYRRWKRDFVGGTSSRRGGGGVRTEDEHRNDIFLMTEIQKDVCRTRSELTFFSAGSIAQQQMTYILFVFAKLHTNVGYIQGMNEILAPIIFVCSADRATTRPSDMEADAFHCFSSVMTSLRVLYGRSPNDPLKTGADLQMSRLEQLLRQHDAPLWQHLNSVGLTPDLYSLRWYMTLLSREFSMAKTLRVWDALLADPKRFSFLHYVSCALVRSQRNHLLHESFTDGLKRLQSIQSTDPTIDIEHFLLSAEHMRQVDRNIDFQRHHFTYEV